MTGTKKAPSSLLDHARRTACRVEEVDLDYGLPGETDAEGDTFGKPGDILANASVGTILATAMLLDALKVPERHRLMRQKGLAMVVKVPERHRLMRQKGLAMVVKVPASDWMVACCWFHGHPV